MKQNFEKDFDQLFDLVSYIEKQKYGTRLDRQEFRIRRSILRMKVQDRGGWPTTNHKTTLSTMDGGPKLECESRP